jgi:hypothetical protein
LLAKEGAHRRPEEPLISGQRKKLPQPGKKGAHAMRPEELIVPLNNPGKVKKPYTIQRDRVYVSISLLF